MRTLDEQVSVSLTPADMELLAGIADSEGLRPGLRARLVLQRWLEDWRAVNLKEVEKMRQRGELALAERRDPRGKPRPKTGPERPAFKRRGAD
jgi:hypothetical protein